MVRAELLVVHAPVFTPEIATELTAIEDIWRQKIEGLDEAGRIKLFDIGECSDQDSQNTLGLSLDVMRSYGVKRVKSETRGCSDGCNFDFTLFETGADLSFIQATGKTCEKKVGFQIWVIKDSSLFIPLISDLYR